MINKTQYLMNKNDDLPEGSKHRRIEDDMNDKHITHTMNLERRIKYNERRKKSVSTYTGPARRFNIDRRMNNTGRRA